VKSKIEIELFEEHETVYFYTIRFQDEETEVDKFLNQFPEGCEYDNNIDILIKWIDEIAMRNRSYQAKMISWLFHLTIEKQIINK
jgi:hypothetical protein